MKVKRTNRLFVISSPSGAGKSTICRKIMKEYEKIKLSISVTTRKARKHEKDGIDYHFVTTEEFMRLKKQDYFLETDEIFSALYGTPRKPIEEFYRKGYDIIFDVNWQGAKRLKQVFAKDKTLTTIFLLPPSLRVLKERLESRQGDDIKTIQERFSQSQKQIICYKEYDYLLINEDLRACVDEVKAIMKVEKLKTENSELTGITE